MEFGFLYNGQDYDLACMTFLFEMILDMTFLLETKSISLPRLLVPMYFFSRLIHQTFCHLDNWDEWWI